MKKRLTKLTSALLVLVMFCGFTMPVMAEGAPESDMVLEMEPVIDDSEDGEAVDSGEETTDPDENGEDVAEEEDPVSSDDVVPDEEETAPSDEPAESDGLELPGMPSSFNLSASQKQSKADLKSSDELNTLGQLIPGQDYVEDEIIFLSDTYEEALTIAEAYGTELDSFEYGVAVAKIPNAADVTVSDLVEVAADTRNNMPVVSANVYYHTCVEEADEVEAGAGPAATVPNDPKLQNPLDTDYQWHHAYIGSFTAWDSTMGDADLKVAVLDTGILGTHEDLAPNLLTAVDMTDTGATDTNGHGTHVSGIVAAMGGNSILGAGVAPNVKLVSVKVLPDTGVGLASSVLRGVNYAVDEGITIVNMSLGAHAPTETDKQVYINAINAGTNIIVAAGNEGGYIKSWPAAYTSDIVVVASVDSTGRKAISSSYGSWVDLAAPGNNVYSTYIGSNTAYTALSGTSMATPVVSGVAALIMSKYGKVATTGGKYGDLNGDGNCDIKDVRQMDKMLKAATTKANSPNIGKGVISAAVAVGNTLVPTFTVSKTSDSTAITGTKVPSGLAKLHFTAGAGDKIYYTIDGSKPTIDSTLYDGTPIALDQTGKVAVRAISIGVFGTTSKERKVTYTMQQVVTGVTLACESELSLGKSLTLKADVAPANATNKKINWSVSGTLPAGFVFNAKTAKLTAPGTNPNNVASITVVATPADGVLPPVSFTINIRDTVYQFVGTPPKNVGLGKTVTFSLGVLPKDAPNKKIDWTLVSDGGTGSTITKEGRFKAGATAGTVQVKAVSAANNTLEATHNIIVINDIITQIKMPAKLTLFTDKAIALDDTLVSWDFKEGKNLADGVTFVNAGADTDSIVWTTGNSKVAKVENGVITPLAAGKVKITAKSNDGSAKSASCTITVKKPVTSITFNAVTSSSLAAGRSMQLKVTTNADATDKGIDWTTASTDVTVNKSGKVTAKKTIAGTSAVITATSKANPNVSMDFTIQLNAVATTRVDFYNSSNQADTASFKKISLFSRADAKYDVPNTVNLTAKANGTDQSVTWKSSNPNVATVTAAGVVTAKSAGKATITATAKDYSGRSVSSAITVTNPVSSLGIGSGKNHRYPQYCAGAGTSVTFKGNFGSAYGKPGSTKLKWSLELDPAVVGGDDPKYPTTQAQLNDIKTQKLISIGEANGKLSIASNIASRLSKTYVGFLVTATTTDGSNESASYRIWVNPAKTKSMYAGTLKGSYVYKMSSYTVTAPNPGYLSVYNGTSMMYVTNNADGEDVTITSSNPNVAVGLGYGAFANDYYEPTYMGTVGYGSYAFSVPIGVIGKGTTTITITSNDGSNKKCSFKLISK